MSEISEYAVSELEAAAARWESRLVGTQGEAFFAALRRLLEVGDGAEEKLLEYGTRWGNSFNTTDVDALRAQLGASLVAGVALGALWERERVKVPK